MGKIRSWCNGVLELTLRADFARVDFVYLSNSTFSDLPHVGNLKSAIVGVFTLWKLTNTTNESIFFLPGANFPSYYSWGEKRIMGLKVTSIKIVTTIEVN